MSVRVFRIENWLKSIKVDTKNMSKKKKKKQKLKKEAEDEAKARDEAEAEYGSQMEIEMESEEITDVDLIRISQKNEETGTHEHEKTYDITLENVKFLEKEKSNDISHDMKDSVEKQFIGYFLKIIRCQWVGQKFVLVTFFLGFVIENGHLITRPKKHMKLD